MNGERSETARENGKCTVHVQARNKHASAISYAESVLPLTDRKNILKEFVLVMEKNIFL